MIINTLQLEATSQFRKLFSIGNLKRFTFNRYSLKGFCGLASLFSSLPPLPMSMAIFHHHLLLLFFIFLFHYSIIVVKKTQPLSSSSSSSFFFLFQFPPFSSELRIEEPHFHKCTPSMVNGVCSVDNNLQLEATEQFCKLLSIEKNVASEAKQSRCGLCHVIGSGLN
ncbi:uncharacterized protein LOC130715477 [Lotus japonicus]|uniref:uncharacterized protein LOC130715477 n=1 Tax=Lotus japonicus TaxID=34305 RepID=UPI00258C34A9|nr:uncharacterized protein LOC130715477 [Lotus japonicus]